MLRQSVLKISSDPLAKLMTICCFVVVRASRLEGLPAIVLALRVVSLVE